LKVPGRYENPIDLKQLDNYLERFHFTNQEVFDDLFELDGRIKQPTFEMLMAKLEPSKSPGSPWCFAAPQNIALQAHLARFKSDVELRVQQLITYGELLIQKWNEFGHGSQQFKELFGMSDDLQEIALLAVRHLDAARTDPILVFRKREPRELNKMPRLVCSVSAVSNLVARLAYGDHLLEEQSHPECAMYVGLDIVSPEARAETFKLFESKGTLVTSDVQGYEWATDANASMVCMYARLRAMCLTKNHKITLCDHAALVVGLYAVENTRVLQLQCGTLLTPPSGQMSSGKLSTLSDNSLNRGWLSEMASLALLNKPLDFVRTQGDDCLDTVIAEKDSLASFYASKGYLITDVAVQNGPYFFCSTTYTVGGAWQDAIWKSVHKALVMREYDLASLLSFRLGFANHPEFARARECLVKFSGTADW